MIDLADPVPRDGAGDEAGVDSGADPVTPRTWAELDERAVRMASVAYAPYSRVRVGAAALTHDGRIVQGCNVENASTGLGICAEVNLVGSLVATGGSRLRAVSIVDGDGRPISPCGRCRQVLHEFGGPGLLVATSDGVMTLGDLLPHPFGPHDVAKRAGDR